MFEHKEFANVTEANEHIKRILAELEVPSAIEFQIIHSISSSECEEDGGEWNSIGEILLNFLLDLDAQQGAMCYDDQAERWDYIECEEPEKEELIVYKLTESTETYVYAGEGVVVLYNRFALCENQYPIIVLKRSFWLKHQRSITEALKYQTPGSDYTAKASPALYVELFYNS